MFCLTIAVLLTVQEQCNSFVKDFLVAFLRKEQHIYNILYEQISLFLSKKVIWW